VDDTILTIHLVNEGIELKIQQTREIEFEVVQCSKKERDLLRKEDDLIKIVNVKESKLNDLMIIFDVSKRALEVTEEILAHREKSRNEVALRINSDRDDFINICRKFQLNVGSNEKAEVYMKFLLKKEYLMGRITSQKKEMKEQCVEEEENIVKLQSFVHVLQDEICDGNYENEKLLKDIDGLKTALQDVNDFKESSWMQSQIDASEEEKRQLEDCILGYQIQLSRLLDEEQRLANAYKEEQKVLQLLEDEDKQVAS